LTQTTKFTVDERKKDCLVVGGCGRRGKKQYWWWLSWHGREAPDLFEDAKSVSKTCKLI